ncbi:hypothetical protein GCM10010156_22520 [Planobispora rosea]|uniref:DUF418 domain-containing protein n=1 Tax=Planobispora rosea TaxID=35762 RepID=A0A8J3RWK0_PLARO|nr:DUF418 domain-containing protein [Planobispora rosea]GGS63102.1 hypothetical protein GCM10010156_22520 [Planobispora rosea]GIH84416.1 hypothetical protein Pro02_28240 [Planobispora rosea]
MTQTAAPESTRIQEIDAVRGFALGGILVANIGFFADPRYAVGIGTLPISEGPVALAVSTLVLTKFYVIFSFLFGYSFTLQMRSWGGKVKARMLRRCLGLFVLGVAHGFLLWIGDILTLYAALGLLLLTMRDVRPRTAVKAGCWIIGVMSVIWLLLAGLTLLDPGAAASPATDAAAAVRAEELVTGGPLDFLRFQVETYPMLAAFVWIGQGPMAMALFLFGLAAGKSRLLEEPERWAHLVPRIMWLGYGVGLPAAVFFTWSSQADDAVQLVGLAVNNVTSLLLATAYVVTLLEAVRRVPAIGGALAPAGRVAASNYIGQSVLACLVFTGYGLALAGELAPVAVMGVAAVIYAVLLALSAWWLRHHRQGPIEWILRRLTLLSSPRPG